MTLHLLGIRAGLAALLCLQFAPEGVAQKESESRATEYQPPRTPDGRPDLQGVWTNASLTRLERPANVKLVISAEEARTIEKNNFWNVERAGGGEAPPTEAPKAGDGEFSTRGYNAFWTDPGTHLGVVKGEIRTSWLVEPPNGRIPSRTDVRGKRRQTLDDPEARIIPERCLIGFGGTGGPGMLNVLYNNHYQIVQTPDHVMILVEMNHDVRIIPIGGQHRPAAITPWLGDSVGRWEGDTLVVETVNVNQEQLGSKIPLSPNGKVTERFTRASEEQIFYEFTVNDPANYTQAWRAEMSLNTAAGPIYEYACHEGNYALPNILVGARVGEHRPAAGVGR